MRKINRIITVLFLLTSSVAFGQQELSAYLKVGAENNPGLQARFKEYMAALEVAPQVKALPDPQLAFAYFIEPVETRMGPQEFKFSVSQMFPWFGTLKAKENIAIQNAKAKYEVFLDTKSKLFSDISANYYNIYFNKKAIAITNQNLEILSVFKNLAAIKVEAGLVSAVDEYRIEMEIGDLQNQLALLTDKQKALEVAFNKLLNAERSSAVNTPDVLWEDDIRFAKEALLDSVRSNNHKLLGIALQQESLKYRKVLANKQGKPDFNLGFEYTIVGKGDQNLAGKDAFVFPKIGITIPLYRNKYKAMINEVVLLETAKEMDKANTQNMLESIFENSWKDYKDGHRRIALYISQLELANKSLNLLETDYATGNKNFEEILRMERKVLKYNLELEKARADKQAAIAFINYLMGK
ncbi:TolC family protein [Labilibaculum sp. K2S]|uniref:TolC family protein n=1 Tax=Labilibaculum sp. K2S TaxID=3056386 RepID=UPI0025A34FDE|nr:TolC family protein [Labilibaculum sp. K2S]MDM8159966.1 TolC family protein [Labilibaculum sp. K2S]